MIVGILSENQDRIDDTNTAAVRAILHLDAQLLAGTETNDTSSCQETLATVNGMVHKCGQTPPKAHLEASGVKVPPTDIILAETRHPEKKP